jgi:predicted transcriptional regulator
MNPLDSTNIPIIDAAEHIFRRPYLFVNPTDQMLQIATFLAIGPQIYADGLVVIDGRKKPIGRISSKHIISNIIDMGYPECLELTALQIMDDFIGSLDKNTSLSKVLEIFNKTKFAFIPITSNDSSDKIGTPNSTLEAEGEEKVVVASISIRDIMPIIVKMDIDRPIKDLSSSLISVDKNSSIRYAIDLMIKHGIRNIGITEDNEDHSRTSSHNNGTRKTKLLRIINDRKILEFLLSHNGRNIMHANGIDGLAEIDIINHLNILSVKKVKCDTTTSEAAELLMDIRNPCLILEGKAFHGAEDSEDYSIVTPWDIVMRTVMLDHIFSG